MGRPQNLWRFSTFALAFLLSCAATLPLTPVHASSQIPLEKLHTEIGTRTTRVTPFVYIREWAEKNGVRIWLFGGSAASFAHYVQWDLEREQGDTRFYSFGFDYHYTSIFRSNQDLDLVLDGSADLASKLQRELAEKFPYFQGNKSAWEVRLLRETQGDKLALLGNPDFLNQHTDSHSVGMVELTRSSEPAVRDLRDWNNKKNPEFLKDVNQGTLHYYWNRKHGSTERAKRGLNPPIFSVVRYLTKAFQFELSIPLVDRFWLKREIRRFDMKGVDEGYVRRWLEKNGPKLIQNAVNVEYAFEALDSLGLREKLLAWSGRRDQVNSLAWWMSRRPLTTSPVGRGLGKTALELGIKTVAHETKSYEAFESILRAHTGSPNVLISHADLPGLGAVHGEGFYTAIGRKGMRHTGLTIRFTLDPKAREGTDFELHDIIVLVKNKAAIRVIPESLHFSTLEYLQLLGTGSIQFDASERGLIEQLHRRLGVEKRDFTRAEEDALIASLDTTVWDYEKIPMSDAFATEAAHLLSDSALTRLAPHFTTLALNSRRLTGRIAELVQTEWRERPQATFEHYVAACISHPGCMFPHLSKFLQNVFPDGYPKIAFSAKFLKKIRATVVNPEVLMKPTYTVPDSQIADLTTTLARFATEDAFRKLITALDPVIWKYYGAIYAHLLFKRPATDAAITLLDKLIPELDLSKDSYLERVDLFFFDPKPYSRDSGFSGVLEWYARHPRLAELDADDRITRMDWLACRTRPRTPALQRTYHFFFDQLAKGLPPVRLAKLIEKKYNDWSNFLLDGDSTETLGHIQNFKEMGVWPLLPLEIRTALEAHLASSAQEDYLRFFQNDLYLRLNSVWRRFEKVREADLDEDSDVIDVEAAQAAATLAIAANMLAFFDVFDEIEKAYTLPRVGLSGVATEALRVRLKAKMRDYYEKASFLKEGAIAEQVNQMDITIDVEGNVPLTLSEFMQKHGHECNRLLEKRDE